MLMKNSEEKRNTAWRAVMTVSSVLIVIVAVFFIVRIFTANPVAGTWVSEEGDITLVIDDRASLQVEDGSVSARTEYTVDRKTKVLTIHVNDDEILEQAEASEGEVTEGEIRDLLESVEGTYDYNIESNTLTLTEREYGSQMVFEKE